MILFDLNSDWFDRINHLLFDEFQLLLNFHFELRLTNMNNYETMTFLHILRY